MSAENHRPASVACCVGGPAEPRFDRITALAADLFDAPWAYVSLVGATRRRAKSVYGLDATETEREHAFSAYLLELGPDGSLVVADATLDPRFASDKVVTGEPRVRFYAGVALAADDGSVLGSLCVLDNRPRAAPTDRDLARLRSLAHMVVDELALGRLSAAEAEKRRLLAMAERMSGVGHWRYDLRRQSITWSAEVYAIHGVSPDAFDPNLQDGIEFYHPEDRDAVRAFLTAVTETDEEQSFQLRIVRYDGEHRTVVCRARRELSTAGDVAALFGVFQDVTKHVRALDAAQRNETRYRLLADNMADVVTRIRTDGASSYVSPAIEALLGYRPEEMAGRPAQDFVHEDDRPALVAAFRSLAAGVDRRTLLLRALRRDGSVRHVETTLQAMQTPEGRREIVGVIRDVTERQALEEALADSERQYRLLADNSTDLINRTNRASDVLYVSPAVETLAGYRPEELIGRKAYEIIHPEDWPRVRREYAKLLHFGRDAVVRPITYRMVRKDGSHVWVEVSPRVVWEGDEACEFVDVVRDVTERKAAEAALEEARRAAEAAAVAKADFLANMSHELRTPLTSIIGFGRLAALQADLPATTRNCVTRIEAAGKALLATVNDILDFSKLEAGQVSVAPGPTDVRRLCEETLELLTPQAAAKDLALRLEFEGDVPDGVLIDPDRVRQILLNYLSNAVKFTAEGSVTLRATYDADGERLRVDVVDTGHGVAADKLDRLFVRFSQVDGGLARTHGGTGLGLAICKGLAEAMNGCVGVASVVGEGSRFWFEIAAPVAVSVASAETAGPADVDGLRVLVVDDNPANRELARLMLSASGCEVTEAEDGVAALRCAETAPFDLVLLDLRMPGLPGPEVLRALRHGGGPNSGVPVVAFSADARDSENELLALGFDAAVAKPLDLNELLRAVAAAAGPLLERPLDFAA
jgi:PAS domain S-box-containing protein